MSSSRRRGDPMTPALPIGRRALAEAIGTFWLVLGGCGSAVIAGTPGGIGTLGVALAFGLSVLTMAYAIGHISGCHLNPAVTIGLWAGRRIPATDVIPYIAAQVAGAICAAIMVMLIATGTPSYDFVHMGLAQNGYGAASPHGYSLASAWIVETTLTAGFVIVILGATDARTPKGFAPIAIGLALTLIHLISIPVTNTSVNPARSTGPALLVGGLALRQLWLFWVAPMLGGLVGGVFYAWLFGVTSERVGARDRQFA